MANIQKRKNSDRSVSYVALVRIKPFKPVSKSFPNKAEAESWAKDLEAELKKQKRQQVSTPSLGKFTIADLAREYLADPNIAALKYHDDLTEYAAWWVNHYGSTRILDIGAPFLRNARAKLQAGRAPRTVNGYLAALRSAWHWGQSAQFVPADRAWPKKLMLRLPKARVRYLSDAELKAALDACASDSVLNAAIRVSIACGLRKGELLRLQWADVDLTGKHSSTGPRLLVRESKNDDPRAVFLPQSAVKALEALKRAPVVGASVFLDDKGQPLRDGQLDWKWRCARKEAGLKDFRWHDLRHSCASYLAQSGATLLEIGEVLGHKTPAVTKRYAHLVQGAALPAHAKLDEKLGGKP